ncbi:hypothetical protein C1645_837111 [Glomus cerebriforme]|uniref:Uncharacterized protein n=1 Tax=Glomus cerebriforme TaxID=658196 RepID=A0A397S975_9GLOM|nr:hypothetical protein C1645_837111 [Glomus cerebriforme]
MYHKANVIGKYMVISFVTNITQPVQPAQQMQTVQNIGIIIGSLISITLISFGVFFLYKWSKKTKCQKYIASIPHILSDC